jgi:hypothetical protein
MKKIILMIAAVTCMVTNNNAQNNTPETRDKVQFGFKIGANLSNVYDSKGEDFAADSKFGLATGAFLSIPIGRFLGVQPEFLFSQKGFQGTGRVLGSSYKFTRTTNYLDIPILFALKPSSEFTLLAGPQYSYLMKQRDVFSNSNTSDSQEKEFANDNIRKNILCFLGGIDINLTNVVLGGRVGWDIQNNNGDGTSSTPRYKNVWYQATIGFRF